MCAVASIWKTAPEVQFSDLKLKLNWCVQLYEHVCDERRCTDIGCEDPDVPATVLLLPPDFQLLDSAQLPELVKLLSVGELRGSSVGGLTFGAEVPEYKNRGRKVSYPSGPTWQVT